MKEVVILGVGVHKWGKYPNKSIIDMGVEAARNALKDAGLEWTQVQEIASTALMSHGANGVLSGQFIEAQLGDIGLPVANMWNMCATSTVTVRTIYNAIAAGQIDIGMAIGLDMTRGGFLGGMSAQHHDQPEYIREAMIGMVNPSWWAFDCRKRMHQYGTTEEDLAMVKVILSQYGATNPLARYQKVFTMEEVLASPFVTEPLRLLEICALSDGAAAAILCTADVARKYTTKLVKIRAASTASSLYGDKTSRIGSICFQSESDTPLISESWMACHRAYELSGIGPSDLDFVELPDNTSWHYLQYIETLDLCKPGEAEKLLRDGETKLGGKIPINPSGGISCSGEAPAAQGLLQIYEVVQQLRGAAGPRQVKGAKVGIAQTYGMGGNSGTVILTI
jgi:acetyl-CoA acetyltransferase